MPITPEQDAKLQKLKSVLAKQPLNEVDPKNWTTS